MADGARPAGRVKGAMAPPAIGVRETWAMPSEKECRGVWDAVRLLGAVRWFGRFADRGQSGGLRERVLSQGRHTQPLPF